MLGAGDAFMSGFLRGYLRDEPVETCCAYANACGAFAVSRLLCSAEYPTLTELQHFLAAMARPRGRCGTIRRSTDLHWATTRDALTPAHVHPDRHHGLRDRPPRAAGDDGRRGRRAARADRRPQAAGRRGRGPGGGRAPRLRHADRRHLRARGAVPRRRTAVLDRPAGRAARLATARFRRRRLAGRQADRMAGQPDDQMPLLHASGRSRPNCATRQERELLRLHDAARRLGRELLVEIIAGKHGPLGDDTVARVIERLYGIGIRPDWWKLESQPGERGLGARSADDDPQARSAVPRHHAARPRRAGGRAGRRVPHSRRPAISSRASRSAARSSASPPGPGSRAPSTTGR